MAATPRHFRFRSRSSLLTYSQCTVPKETLLEFLKHKFNAYDIKFIRVGHELHEDGGHHLHAAVLLKRAPNLHGAQCLDILHTDGVHYHPNIEGPLRDINAAITYAGKDDDYIDHGDLPDAVADIPKWGDLLSAATKAEFMEKAKSFPRDYILYYDKFEAFADKHYALEIPPYVAPDYQWAYDQRYPDIDIWKNQRNVGNFFPLLGLLKGSP